MTSVHVPTPTTLPRRVTHQCVVEKPDDNITVCVLRGKRFFMFVKQRVKNDNNVVLK